MKRFSIRALLLMVAVSAVVLGLAARFLHTNYADWKRERANMIQGAVRWEGDFTISNLDLYYTSTLPDWMISWLPLDQQDVFYRVTALDNMPGTASADDFERCLAFRHVDTVHLWDVEDIERLAAVLKKFPRLKTIRYGREFDDGGETSISETLRRELPDVELNYTGPPSRR